MNTTLRRITDPTPPYWRKVQWIFGVLGAILIAALPTVNTIEGIPAWLPKMLELGIAVSAAIVGMAQLTTTNKST